MGTHPIFESDFDCLTEKFQKMAKSLRSKRMRRNRALQAEKKAPRVLKRLKENLEQAKKFNTMRDAEKAKIEATKSEEMKTEERVEESTEKDEEMTDANKPELCIKTGLLKDGGKPAWMNDRKFKKLKGKANAKKNKFEPNKFGIGPHKKVIKNQTKRKK